MALPDAPETPWNEDGQLQFGTYRGECTAVPIDAHYGTIDRVRAQKRWQWVGVMTPEVAVGVAIVRTGYAANVFCWVFDRQSAEFLQDVTRVVPRLAVEVSDTPPVDGVVAKYGALVEGIAMTRSGPAWMVSGGLGDSSVELSIEELGTCATAICPSGDDRLNVTRKQTLARARGSVRVGTKRFDVTDGAAMLDHSHGMMARETIWQWAIGNGSFDDDDSPIGLNLVASFNDSLENTLWLSDEPEFVGPVEFEIPEDQRDEWRVHNDRVDLTMAPEACRSQELDLGVVVSDYVQPLGTWRGRIDGRNVTLQGVAELHRSVW